MITIYALVDPRTGNPRYVGATRSPGRRLTLHLNQAKAGVTHSPVADWLRSLQEQDVRPQILTIEVVEGSDWEERERHWIAAYRAAGHSLTNVTDGGKGNRGWKASPQTRERMSAAALQRCSDPVERERLASISNGKPPIHRGEDNNAARFSEADVLEMRELNAAGVPRAWVAEQFHTSKAQVSYVVTGQTWKHVGGPIEPVRVKQRLSDEQVMEIRTRASQGETQSSLAREFGLTASYVNQIVTGARRVKRNERI